MGIRQALAWWCFARGEMTPERLVRAAADMGYDAIELVEPPYWPLVRDHGLSISAIGGHRSLTEGLNRREYHAGIVRELEENIRVAEKWSIPVLICFSGNRAGLNDVAGVQATVEGLRRVARQAQDAGVTLALELLNSKVDHPDYQADHTAWGVAVVEGVASPAVKLLYDIYHMQIMDGDIIRTIRDQHANFAHYHTAGNPGRHELDETQELAYAAIFRAIAATGYQGIICHEFLPVGDAVAGLRAAHQLCERAISEGLRRN